MFLYGARSIEHQLRDELGVIHQMDRRGWQPQRTDPLAGCGELRKESEWIGAQQQSSLERSGSDHDCARWNNDPMPASPGC